jgi:hypothetical protein
MLQEDIKDPQGLSMTQLFMGIGLWSVDNVKKMVSSAVTGKGIGQAQVQSVLENPDGYQAACVSQNVVNEILAGSIEAQKNPEHTPQMQKEIAQELEQPNINSMQIPG